MLENQIESFRDKCQRAIQIKNRLSATAALKSKKAAESALSQRLGTLSQLEGVYQKIEQAADQIMLVRVLEGSTATLRSLNAKSGGSERVEDIVDQLQEEMDKTDDVRRAIDEAGQTSDFVDEDAIEDELETLVAQNREAEEAKEAEQTKERLVEIQGPEHTSNRQQSEKPPTKTDDIALVEDMSRLERMSLNEDNSTAPDHSAKEAARSQKQFSAVPEP